eukprot:scaffold4518_cov410-Prasinococcus_capsulatus_cf.AAC.36
MTATDASKRLVFSRPHLPPQGTARGCPAAAGGARRAMYLVGRRRCGLGELWPQDAGHLHLAQGREPMPRL